MAPGKVDAIVIGRGGVMRVKSKRMANFLYWPPRIICILFACFISLFALDVFGEGQSFWETALALMMHLVPTALVILVLVIAWRWEWVGGVLFAALGLFYIVNFWGRFPLIAYVMIAGPLFLMSSLFFLTWRYKDEIRNQRLGTAECQQE
jgi:hypothetical protein